MTGYYLMYRGWQEHPVFRGEVFSRRDAWLWLIERAKFGDVEVGIGPHRVLLRRGQFSDSFRFMATAWKWEESRVRRFISRLKSEKMIVCVVTAGQNLITICNYDTYQPGGSGDDAETAAASPQHRRSIAAKNKEGNEGNKSNSLRSSANKAEKRKRGSRWPDGVPVPAEWLAKAVEHFPDLNLPVEAVRFVNHWSSSTSPNAVKLSWDRAFVNWLLKARDDSARWRK